MRYWSLALLGWVAACAPLPPEPPLPPLPAGVFGTYEDNATGAINQSSWAFASSANLRNNPVGAIRAMIALEYLPEELAQDPRWVEVAASVPLRLNQARDEMRRIVGIRPDAAPRLVVGTLLALETDLLSGDRPAAMQVLRAPIFLRPPDAVLATLSHLPYIPAANLATAEAAMQARAGGAGG